MPGTPRSLSNGTKFPAKFLTIFQNKLKAKGRLYYEVNTKEIKASQYNHLNRQHNEKKLSQRWNYFEYNNKSIKVQRDIYSAYLIKNVNNDKCIKDFDELSQVHDKEI